MKRVAIHMLDSGSTVERDVAPGTTAADLLRSLNLPNGLVSLSQNGDFVPNSDEIYTKVKEGQKLSVSSPAEVGSSRRETITSNAIKALDVKDTSTYPSVVTLPYRPGGALRRAVPLVERQQIPYWRQRGWRISDGSYTGNYATPYGAYSGWASVPIVGVIEFYIQNPPDCVFDSSHAACFRPRGKEWFLVHMAKRPQGVSSGIIAIERLITECFRTRRYRA